jgi:hypothetical protein
MNKPTVGDLLKAEQEKVNQQAAGKPAEEKKE